MKKIIVLSLLFICLSACNKSEITNQIVEASCGQCQFKMEGSGCDLAIKFDNKSYYVEGTDIDDHGDAHASDGFCEAIKTAEVTGTIKEGKFVVTSFKVIEK